MMPDTEQEEFAMQGRTFLHWIQTFLIVTGALAVAFVALSLLYARAYQEASVNALEKQINAQAQHHVRLTHTAVKEGDVLGRFEIPRLRETVAILEGTSSGTLRLGVGHIKGTALPGDHGNVGIAGHRDTFFRTLKDIRTGDEIIIQTASGLSSYEVDSVKIVSPRATEVLAPSTQSALTLVTCYPFYFIGPAPERFVVHARSVEQK